MKLILFLLVLFFVFGASRYWMCARPPKQFIASEVPFHSCAVIRYTYANSCYEFAKGEEVFDRLLQYTKRALSGSPNHLPSAKTCGTLTLLDTDGNTLLSATLFNDTLVVEGMAFEGSGAFIASLAEETWRQRTYYYSNGKLKAKGIHKEGMKDGLWTYYFEDGSIKSTGCYRKGDKVGKWTIYSMDTTTPDEIWYLGNIRGHNTSSSEKVDL